MPEWIVYTGYVAIVALVVFLSVKLGKYVDVIDAKSNISGAFIGGVMLAAVTSLPELFTSLSAVWVVKENSLVIGNILGSDLINLAFFGVMLLLFGRGLKNVKFSRFYYAALGVALGMYGLVSLGLYLGEYLQIGWYNVVSPLILVLYLVFVNRMPKTAEAEGGADDVKLTLKSAVVRFCICAVVLIGASICMTYLTDIVSDNLALDKTFAGALFLGVATSLPELISSSTLCIRGNYNAAAGNIIGSNVFNFMILFVADVFSFGRGATDVYLLNADSKWLLILGAVATVFTAVMFMINNNKRQSKGMLVGVYAANTVPPILYVVYLLISTGIIVL